MTRTILTRTLYARITVDGKRKYVEIGTINRSGTFRWTNRELLDSKGMPLPGLFEV